MENQETLYIEAEETIEDKKEGSLNMKDRNMKMITMRKFG